MSCYSYFKLNESANESFSPPLILSAGLEQYLSIFHVACAPLTIILNTVVLYIGFTKIDKSVRLNQVYVISMTVGDLAFGVGYLSTKLSMECFPTWICRVYYVLIWFSQLLSVTSLLLLNVDKFISLHYPLKYQQIVTKELVTTLAALSWCLSLSYPSVVFLGPLSTFSSVYLMRNNTRVATVASCYVTMNMSYYLVMLVGFYVVPTLLSLGISIYIFWVAQYITHSYLEGVAGSRVTRKRARQKIAKRILFVFSSTTWTAVTSLPYRILYCVLTFCAMTCLADDSTCRESCAPSYAKTLGYSLWFLLPMGCMGNPIITVVTQRIYRIQLLKLLKHIFVVRFGCSEQTCSCLNQRNDYPDNTSRGRSLIEEPSNVLLRLRGTSLKRGSLAAVFQISNRRRGDRTPPSRQASSENML